MQIEGIVALNNICILYIYIYHILGELLKEINNEINKIMSPSEMRTSARINEHEDSVSIYNFLSALGI